MRIRAFRARPATQVAGAFIALSFVAFAACVPPGNSEPSTLDAGGIAKDSVATSAPTFRPSANVMAAPFEDAFERSSVAPPVASAVASASPTALSLLPDAALVARRADAGDAASAVIDPLAAEAGLPVAGPNLGPDWAQIGTNVWHIEKGRLCGSGAHNHGVWLQRVLPVNARIEFDAISDDLDGDIKGEFWGDGRSAATGLSYTNATSYLAILGGWHNKEHVLARLNEHGTDRKEIKVDKDSDDPSQKPVVAGQVYHFKIERNDGKTVRWSVDGLDYLNFVDPQPLAGFGHDHFGFNDWEAKVCFDNVKVTPL